MTAQVPRCSGEFLAGPVRFCGAQPRGHGVQNEAVLAARRSVVTVEEIVDVLEPLPGAVVLPAWTVGHVALVPGGGHPSYALGYTTRDNDFYVGWDAISRDRETFTRWLDRHVFRADAALLQIIRQTRS